MADVDVINSLSSVFTSTANAIRKLSGKTSKIKPSSFADEIMVLNKVYYLGQGTSFDVSSLLPNIDMSKLTANNFIVEPVNINVSGSSTGGASGKMYGSDGGDSEIWVTTSGSNSVNITKSYSNGILTVSNSNVGVSNEQIKNDGSTHAKSSFSATASITAFRAYLMINAI